MAQPKGSGIATYARNLAAAARRLGYRTEILYGPESPPGDDNLLNDITLFDAPPPATAIHRVARYARQLVRLPSSFNQVASRVVPTGAVVTDQIASAAPPCDGLWSSGNVFHAANRAYSARGRFTSLRFAPSEQGAPHAMHWTCPLPIRAPGLRNFYTIHDLVPLRLPFTTLDNKRNFLNICREICATADQVVTVSEHSKRDIVRFLGVSSDRITVTYQAVKLPEGALARADNDIASEIAGVFGLDWQDYFVFFGAIEPKKNLGRVIAAYLASGVKAPLVIIGGKAWLDDEATQLAYPDLVQAWTIRDERIRRTDRIRRYEFLPFELLVSLIRGAKATLLPSLYEGFGLPVLESMLLRTPVLASTAGSLPEVAGEAALLVDPYDTQAIRRAIEALDADSDLRAELSARGLSQAAKFSSEAYDARLADLYGRFE